MPARRYLPYILIFVLFQLLVQESQANEITLKANDFELQINTTWTGCHAGGYWPVRIRTLNRGAKRTIGFSISHMDTTSSNLNVSTSFTIDQGVTLDETLLIPMVSMNDYMSMKTSVNGYNVKELSSPITLNSSFEIPTTPAILLVNRESSTSIKEMEEVSSQLQNTRHLASATSPTYSHGSYSHNVTHLLGYNQNLPATWLGYTGLDLVVCDVDTFIQLETQRQEAMISWVQSGGNLILSQKEVPDEIVIATTAKFIGEKRDFKHPTWQSFRPDTSQAFRLERDPATGNVTQSPSRTRDFAWPVKDRSIRQIPVMNGYLSWAPFDMSKGGTADWSWLMTDNNLKIKRLSDRTGVHSRGFNLTFGTFSIPGIQSVPVASFLVLITAFTILIGPLNYVYFQRKKQLAMLLVSIPVLAFTTSVLLILYATVAHGFSVKGRVRSLMMVDQQVNKSVTHARSALYAGQAPSRLKFTADTAIFPIWPQKNGFERGNVDWSKSQQLLQGGWIRSRTRTQFFTTQVKTERGRLNVETPLAGKLPVTNGFNFDMKELVVIDSSGQLYHGKDIQAGKAIELLPLNKDSDRQSFANLFKDKVISSDDYVEPVQNSYYRYGYINENNFTQEIHNNLPEALRSELSSVLLQEQPDLTKLPVQFQSKAYFAVLKNNPDVDLGLTSVQQQESSHLLIGKY